MKPIFGIDVTLDKKNETCNGEEFITNTIAKEQIVELEEEQEKLDQTIKDSKLPLLMRAIKNLSGAVALIIVLGIVKALPTVGLMQAFKNAPFLFIGALVCASVWAFLQFAGKQKEKHVLADQNAEHKALKIDARVLEIYHELNVPFDAVSVDVLMFSYKIKNGEVVAKASGISTTPYINIDVKAYATAQELCLADLESVYSFKLEELKGIKTVNKRIAIPLWNKEEEPTKGEFKQYKMAVNNLGDVFFKPYYILEGERNGEVFGIYFPCYELATFEKLTGLKAEE